MGLLILSLLHAQEDSPPEFVVRFESSAPGAQVVIGGKEVCSSTPCSRAIPGGEHEVTFRHPMRETVVMTIQVEANMTVKADQPDTSATIVLKGLYSGPEGLPAPFMFEHDEWGVLINGKPSKIGSEPEPRFIVPAGDTTIEFQSACWESQYATLDLAAGEVGEVTINKLPRVGRAHVVASDPEGNAIAGVVKWRDQVIGKAPGTVKVPLCEWTISVLGESGDAATVSVNGISEGALTEVPVTLRPEVPQPGSVYQLPCDRGVQLEVEPHGSCRLIINGCDDYYLAELCSIKPATDGHGADLRVQVHRDFSFATRVHLTPTADLAFVGSPVDLSKLSCGVCKSTTSGMSWTRKR